MAVKVWYRVNYAVYSLPTSYAYNTHVWTFDTWVPDLVPEAELERGGGGFVCIHDGYNAH